KLVFVENFEYYYQHAIPLSGITVPGLLTDNVPTLSMRAGNFDMNCPSGAGSCVGGSNSSPGASTVNDNGDLCNGIGFPNVWGPTCANMGSAFSFVGGSGTQLPAGAFDPGAAAIMSHVPFLNDNPAFIGGFNFLQHE